jgi:AraC-like DNA-binding protein
LGPLSLIQIGDLSCDSEFELLPHEQPCFEISYIVTGKGSFATDGISTSLEAGDIYLGRPDDIHQGKADANDPYRYFYLGFDFHDEEAGDNSFLQVRQMMENSQALACRDRFHIHAPFVGALKELSNVTEFTGRMLQHYVEQIVLLTYRNFFTNWEAAYPRDGLNNTSKKIVYSAITYIDENVLRISDSKEVADRFGYSLTHLSHLFAKETGYTIHNYLTMRKWQKAIELLQEGNYSITEVATIMNFASIHTFSRAFRKATGLTPSQYTRKERATKIR